MERNYTPPSDRWAGRSSDPSIGIQYWYQAVNVIDLPSNVECSEHIGLVGYVCDEGVRRNQGRIGAKEGAAKVIERLGKLPYHHDPGLVADFGDIRCDDEDLESCQLSFAKAIQRLIGKGILPIAIGGGHDIAYGHVKAIISSVPKGNKIGIINFDAHFDLRHVEDKANSGTPFGQLLIENADALEYMVLGIQQTANTKELYDKARLLNVRYIENYSCQDKHWEKVERALNNFISEVDCIYITIDMDGFSSAYAPGVSAPSPLGFTPYFVLKCLNYIFKSRKVISCDIAEVNPDFDQDNMTSNLAARLVDFIVERYSLYHIE
ncbi:MAG: formiminoglutamase [Saprospiraceae bacterium]|jgi:formiminoglutamase